MNPWEKKAALETSEKMGAIASISNRVAGWPPVLHERFPNIALFDHMGKPFSMNSLQGKPVLVVFVAMTCAACEAFSGAGMYGGYDGLASQKDLESIESYFKRYTGGVALLGGPVQFVQIIFYNTSLEAPTPQELTGWRTHFHFDNYSNAFVVSGGEPLRNGESFQRIPGFLLLDKELKVRYESLGHSPRHNLYRDLLPGVRGVV